MSHKTPLYFVPGLAANPSIFDYLKLSKEDYEFHFLEWLVPVDKDESLDAYVKRWSAAIKHENAVLIGVSFGGVIVQEMKKYVNPKQVIIISSIKNKHEMPVQMRFSQKTNFHKALPTKIFSNIEKYEKFAFTTVLKKRVKLYKKFLSMRDELYIPWAINALLNWDREDSDEETIHIHGTNDFIFPSGNIEHYLPIEEGTHIMIIDKADAITSTLNKVLV